MMTFLKKLFKRVCPRLSAEITSRRNRIFFEDRHGATRQACATKLFPGAKPIVMSGPFSGLNYINDTTWGPITPKWLGTYELELWPAIDEMRNRSYTAFIDVGCAEGYYAVGLARLLPNVPVFAYDTDPAARRQCRRMGDMNGMGVRLAISTLFSPNALGGLPKGRKLLMMDIEGYEMLLLSSNDAKMYRECDVIVEIHLSASTA